MQRKYITRYSRLELLSLFFVLLACTSRSQTPKADVEATKDIATPTVPVQHGSANFVLGSGDQITVHVQDFDEIPDKAIKIDPDGGVDLPLIGRMQAAGLTIQQFKQALSVKVSKYVSDPQISVNLAEGQSSPVSVIGEVNAPGVHQLPGPRSLIEVISLAGGVKADAGSKVIVTRELQYGDLPLPAARRDISGRFSTASLSLDDLLSSKRPADNITVEPEDVISIPKGDVIYVVGDVRRAGGFPLSSHETITLLQALSLAEGLGPDAASQRSKILRPVPGNDGKPREIPVDVKGIFAGKSPDVPLYANDILFIPSSVAKSGTRRAAEAVLQVATGVAIYSR
jgi:polysaccharide export outer membrane protein